MERCLLSALVATFCSASRDTPTEHARAACVSLRRDRGNGGYGEVGAFLPCLLKIEMLLRWQRCSKDQTCFPGTCMNLSPLGLDTEKLRKFGSLSASAWL